MKLHSYHPPEIEEGDTHPSLRINVYNSTWAAMVGRDPVHSSAIIIYGEALIAIVLPLLKLLGVPKHR